MTDRRITIRLWGDAAMCSEVQEKRHARTTANMLDAKPEEIVIERMTAERIAQTTVVEKKGKRGGVDGGTGKDADNEDERHYHEPK